MLPHPLTELAAEVLRVAGQRGERLATAESCTGGLVAAALTAIAGSSSVVERGFVTYSNEAKAEMLGVPPALITTHGAVSREVDGGGIPGQPLGVRVQAEVAARSLLRGDWHGQAGSSGKCVGTLRAQATSALAAPA